MAVIDPYRTLGLSPGASFDDVKAAYRRLAKRYHPDSAGPAAVTRFLEVQHAYEMLTIGRLIRPVGRPRPARPATRPRPSASGGRPERPRTERPRTERPRTERAERPRPERPRTERPGTERPRPDRPAGENAQTERPHSARRKATLGSTSYDEAMAGPFEADWRGASWYGTGSGTYWTVNPREYADPRKHGPEYQERARRAAAGTAIRPDQGSGDDLAEAASPASSARPAAPTWSTATSPPSPDVDASSPPYRGILALGLAIVGLILGLLMLFVLFGRP
jgi:hypothetical protein